MKRGTTSGGGNRLLKRGIISTRATRARTLRRLQNIRRLMSTKPLRTKDAIETGDSMARYRSKMPKDVGALEEAIGVIDEVKNLLNMGKVKKLFRMGTALFAAFQPFIEKPTWWNAGRAGLEVGKVLVDDVEVWSENYFDGDEWTQPYSRDFNMTILDVLARFPYQQLKTAEENSFIRLIDLNGCRAGWTYNNKLNCVDHIYVETEKAQIARDSIKRMLWEQFKGQPLVMRHNRRMVISSDEPRIVFEVDDAFHPMPSEKATEYSTYLQRCLTAGVPRSVMLYGPPGTGKSTMARTLVENLKLRSFRIRVEDVSGLENSTLFEAISIFEPDAVILDDFDRAHAQVALLETLEFFQRHVKLVVATVNDKQNLDEALLRPGRFDELVLIDKMDEGVVKHMLGEYEDGFDAVKEWPIAFIQEYVKRRRFMDPAEAAASTAELARRVRRLDRYRDQDDTDTMWRALKRRKSLLRASGMEELLKELDEPDEEDEEGIPTPPVVPAVAVEPAPEPAPQTERSSEASPAVVRDDTCPECGGWGAAANPPRQCPTRSGSGVVRMGR